MKKINVIDLDGTLIPFDSSRKFVFHFLKQPSTFFSFSRILALRILKIYDSKFFFKKIVEAARKHKNYEDYTEKLAQEIIANLIPERLKIIAQNTDQETLCVLCSASINDYVKFVGDYLGWEVVASSVSDSEFVHMHGAQKLVSIRELYPEISHEYYFAMGDSDSDLFLMEAFKEYKLVVK